MKLLNQNRISKELINSLPVIRFEGEVNIINSPEEAEKALKKLFREKVVGFDTESRPSFKVGESYPISLVQLATMDRAFLFKLNGNGMVQMLAPLLTSKNINKIGVGLEHDISKMKGFNGITLYGLTDLSNLAREKGIIQTGARGLTARYIGKRLVKSAQITNWARSELTEKQKIYAATDAWICLMIYHEMLKDKTDYRKFIVKPNENEK